MDIQKAVTEQEIAGTFTELIQRLYRKKEEVLAATNRIVALSERPRRGNIREAVEQIKKELNVVLECLSELQPHTKNKPLIVTLSGLASRLVWLSNAEKHEITWPLWKHEIQQFCLYANQITLTPTRKSLEMAVGVKIRSQWAELKGILRRAETNY